MLLPSLSISFMKQVEKDIYRRGLEMTNGKIERAGEEDVRDGRESCNIPGEKKRKEKKRKKTPVAPLCLLSRLYIKFLGLLLILLFITLTDNYRLPLPVVSFTV